MAPIFRRNFNRLIWLSPCNVTRSSASLYYTLKGKSLRDRRVLSETATKTEQKQDKRIQLQFPLVLLRTKRGLALLDSLGKKRVTYYLGWLLLYILPVSAAVGFYLVLRSMSILLSSASVREFARQLTPLANLLIPGLNPYLPIIYGWIALIIGLVVHEGAHGVLARSLGFPVKSSGLLFFLVLPVGAFVEVDDKELAKAKARDSGRVLAAGPGSNITVAAVALLGLILVVGSMTPVVDGLGIVGVVQDSQAEKLGIMPGSIVVSAAGVNILKPEDFETVLDAFDPGDAVSVSMHNQPGIRSLQFTIPIGVVLSGVIEGYPAQAAGVRPADLVVALDDAPIKSRDDLVQILAQHRPGDTVSLRVERQGEIKEFRLTLAGSPLDESLPFLGVASAPLSEALGLRTISLTGVLENYRSLGATNPFVYLVWPTFGASQQNIPFSDLMHGFYTSSVGDAYFILANLLFWIWFVNFNLAIFNALPIYPLDGGQALKSLLRGVGKNRLTESMISNVTNGITLVMVFLVLSLIVAPYLG